MASLSMQRKTRAVLQSSDKLIADQRRSLLNIFICFFFPKELQKSACYQHNCVDGIWNGSEQEKNEQDDSRRNLFLHFCMISLHFCRAGRQQIGCVKWNLYRQERQQTSPIPYDYCIFAFSCLSISFSNVTSAGKKKGKDCRKHQEEDSVSSARNMNKRIFWIGTLRRISCFLNLFLTWPNARARTAMNEEGWRCEITGKSRIGGVSQQPSRESLQCS